MVAALASSLKVRVYVDIDFVPSGGFPAMTGGLNANDPAQGQSLYPIDAGVAQTLRVQAAELVPGTAGSFTLANINTALTSIVTDIAGASGTPIISAAMLATINGWATGNP